MKATQLLIYTAVVAMFVFYPGRVFACPHCNVHNYLAASVRSSTNIFVGKVIRAVDDKTAEVEVVKSLRGDYEVGSKVKTKMYKSKDYLDKQFIFSNPTSWDPRFEVLTPDYEDEVLFLMEEEPSVNSVKQAIKRVQGVSVMTQAIGMEYLTKHYDEATDPLIKEIKILMPKVLSEDDVFFGEHRLGKLLEALLSKESDQAKEFVLTCITQMGQEKDKKINWESIPNTVSSQGVFLSDIFRHSQKHNTYAQALSSRLNTVLPTLSETALAETAYALVVSETDTLENMKKRLESANNPDAIALGLYFAGNYESRWWQHKKAYALWDAALALAEKEELREVIAKRLKDSEEFVERETEDNEPAAESKKE